MKKLIFVSAVALAGTVSLSSGAFPFLRSWHEPSHGNTPGSIRGGGGDIYGTGSAQDWGIKCSHCHIEGDGTIGADIDVNPAFQMLDGEYAYTPGQRYIVTVSMTGEHKGLNQGDDNLNGVAVVIEDANGDTAGDYYADSGVDSTNCPSSAPPSDDSSLMSTYVYGDCHGVLFTEERNLTTWTFDWVAPNAGTGDVTLFFGLVDGDSHGKSSLDDDVKEGAIAILEGS